MADNVYLFVAAQGLAAWFHDCDKARLAAKLELDAEKRVLLARLLVIPLSKNVSRFF